jgi:hypothetical protein
MSTYGALKTRVADELNRSDLTSQIETAIQRAIEYYARERFDFNEGRSTAATVADAQYVDFPSGLRVIDEVLATVGATSYPMRHIEFDEMEIWHGATLTVGQPLDYAVRKRQFRIYPTPNQAYTLTITGIYDEPALSADGDTNSWCTDLAQDVIVARAKYTISRDILFDREGMEHAKLAEREALQKLRDESDILTNDEKVDAGW